jgi:hypothetical protein
MKNFEQLASTTAQQKPKIWLRYVDDNVFDLATWPCQVTGIP